MAVSGRSSKESYSYLVKFLGTFKQGDPREMGVVQAEAVRAAVEFMKSPDTFQVGEKAGLGSRGIENVT